MIEVYKGGISRTVNQIAAKYWRRKWKQLRNGEPYLNCRMGLYSAENEPSW